MYERKGELSSWLDSFGLTFKKKAGTQRKKNEAERGKKRKP